MGTSSIVPPGIPIIPRSKGEMIGTIGDAVDPLGFLGQPPEVAVTSVAVKGSPSRPRRKRRLRGEGSVYQRKDKIWVGNYGVGFDEKGRRKRLFVYARTQREVVEKLKSLRGEIDNGITTRLSAETLQAFLRRWLNDQVTPNCAPATVRSYKGVIEKHINGRDGIGYHRLREITPKILLSFQTHLRDNGVGGRTRQLIHAVLHHALRDALRQDLILRNPTDRIDAPKYKSADRKPLTLEEVKRFFAAAEGDRLEALYILATFSGIRQGELLALTWLDFDEDNLTINVQKSQRDLCGALLLGPTKTVASRRKVPLPQFAVDALRYHREFAITEKHSVGPNDRIFTAPDGGPLRRKNFCSRSFKPLLERARIAKETHFHDLRRTFATILIENRVPAKIVQQLLGHTRVTTTLDVYVLPTETAAREAVAILDQIFGTYPRERPTH